MQDQYREAAPPLLIPAADKQDAHPGTVGTAADWLLRFLMNPQPDMHLPLLGVIGAARAGIDLAHGFAEVLEHAGIPRATTAADLRAILKGIPVTSRDRFDGPRPGNALDPDDLNRACWVIALLTEVFRRGPVAAARGPLARYAGKPRPSGEDLLALAPPAGLDQLSRFRDVFTGTLLPQLAAYRGAWAIGPTFTGSRLIKADADLITAGLLLDLKTTAKPFSLPLADIFQIIGYALLDFDDEFGITRLGVFSARYGHLITWDTETLLRTLAQREVTLPALRREFRDLLLACQP